MIITEIFIFLVAFLIAKYFWKHKRFYYLASKIPFSTFDFSLKGLYDFMTADNQKMFRLINSSFYNKSDLAKTWLGPILFIITNNPDDVRIVFNSRACFDKPYFVKFAEIYKGSLFGDLEYWRSHKRIMNPFFGMQGLRSAISIFNEKSKILVRNLESMVGKEEFNIFNNMTALTLETILKVMDYDVDIQNKEHKSRDTFIKNLENYSKITSLRMFKVWQHPDIVYKKILNLYRIQYESMINSAMVFATDIMKKIRSNMKNNESKKPKNFMEALMNPKNNLTDEEIRDEVNSVVLAAQDTSAIASSTTLLMLGMFKDVQHKVVEELYRVFGRTQDTPFIDYDKLSQLEYLEMVINEVMRLFPVVPFVVRQCDDEIILSNNYVIPVGASLIIPIIRIHRNEKYWGKDAEYFKPERFEKKSFKTIHPYAYLPFTKGPRMCLGYRYAMILMKIQLANFLMRYEVDTSLKFDELEFSTQVTLTVCQGYRISIKERNLQVENLTV